MVKKIVKPKVKKPRAKKSIAKSTGQTQTQNVTVNISKPSTTARKPPVTQPVTQSTSTGGSARGFALPMAPSFNVNQPSQTNDLAKLIGLINTKLETDSKLGAALSTKAEAAKEPPKPVKPSKNIGGLKDPTESVSLGDAVDITAPKPKRDVIVATPSPPELTGDVIATELPPPAEATAFVTGDVEGAKMGPPVISSLKVPSATKKRGKGKSESAPENIPVLENYYPLMSELPFSGLSSTNPLDIRYEKAFGYPYEGPNLKEKDFQKMIIQQEKFNKQQKRLEKEQRQLLTQEEEPMFV